MMKYNTMQCNQKGIYKIKLKCIYFQDATHMQNDEPTILLQERQFENALPNLLNNYKYS